MNVGGPAFTHVMYADDIFLFARANGREVKIWMNALKSTANGLVNL